MARVALCGVLAAQVQEILLFYPGGKVETIQ